MFLIMRIITSYQGWNILVFAFFCRWYRQFVCDGMEWNGFYVIGLLSGAIFY